MTKPVNYFLACVLTALSVSSVHAAEEASEATENSSVSNAEEFVLNPTAEVDAEESGAERPEGDDDFVPSAQISEDLSVSFPVDI
ncbi:MAG: hypothetical protein COA71_01705 [SAR86 cluster bacterium]|uniref:Secreted protein n=1 Tax=SAR86 cluster bacterium TaxID=2030880 RepID=A0A2A5CIK2_9GAMM|nr:MAG: hypothetical protein COA71_01705 [SAR86 cluster bacterium]